MWRDQRGGGKGGIPSTLLAPWVRGVCDGGDGGGNSPTPSWVRAGEDVRGDGEFTPLIRPGVGTEVGEDGGPVVVASRSALPSKRGSSLPWVRGSSLPWVKGIVAERVRLATVGAGGGSTCGVKKGARLGRIGGGGTGGAPAVPTEIVSGGGGWEGGSGREGSGY